MQAIKGKNTNIELFVRTYLHKVGFRYRLHAKHLPGRPDLVLKKYNTVIFINGCFWHQHENCRLAAKPKSNSDFWSLKLGKNKTRDKENIGRLKKEGWNVVVIWECELKESAEKRINELKQELLK